MLGTRKAWQKLHRIPKINQVVRNNLKFALELQFKTTKDLETRNSLIQILNKSVYVSKGLMKLRQDIQKKKKLKLVYDSFTPSEPNFVNRPDKRYFLLMQARKIKKGKIQASNYPGFITWTENAAVYGGKSCNITQSAGDGCRFCIGPQLNIEPQNNSGIRVFCPLIIRWGSSFQHFIEDVMPKLIQVYNYVSLDDVVIMMLPPRRQDQIVHEILRKLGFTKTQIVPPKHLETAHAVLNPCNNPKHPDIWRVFRSMLDIPEHHKIPHTECNVVLLTRARSHIRGRNTVNQAEVYQYLQQRYGTNSTLLFRGGYNLSESIQIFSKAQIVMGVHGGAFYNINFCKKGTFVIEVYPLRFGSRDTFWHQSAMLGHRYWRIFEKPLNKFLDVNITLNKLQIALDKVDQHLQNESQSLTSVSANLP